MAQRPDLIGQQFGSYRLLSLLGAGGFAEVYLGEHVDLGTQAAIKVLHTQLSSTDIKAFRTEARTIARLLHPHIIRVLDFNAAGSTAFLVMDYAVGGTMRERYPRGTTIPLATVVSYIQQVADALQYAHDQKVIHRDIKPENILLDKRNNILLSDFGIALVTQSSRYQSTQEVIGTAAYMSPEQIQGRPRATSDQYSLGIVVYEWLSGTRPFEGSFTELCTQHLFAPPPPLREKVPISPEVERVVMTALAKDPKQRFDSVRTFANALQQASQRKQYVSLQEIAPPRDPPPEWPKQKLSLLGIMTKSFLVGDVARLFRQKKTPSKDDSTHFPSRWYERLVCALNHMFLGVPGLFFLLFRGKKRFVRFYLLQSILFFIFTPILVAISVLLLVPVVLVGWFVGICLPLSGKRYKLLTVGNFVERRIANNNTLGKWYERLICALNHMFLGVPGLFYLLFQGKKRFVRFYLLQSILFFIFTPILVAISVLLLPLIIIIGFFVGIYASLQGKCYKFPFVGNFLAKRISSNIRLK